MSPQRFIVATDLGFEEFDDIASGRALVRLVMAEVEQLRRLDPRVVRARLRTQRGRAAGVEVALTIEAESPIAAYEIGTAVMRASIHAAGGSTVGWERACSQVLRVTEPTPRRGTRPRTTALDRPQRDRAIMTWTEATATADRRVAAVGPLPPFAAPFFEPQLIDLR